MPTTQNPAVSARATPSAATRCRAAAPTPGANPIPAAGTWGPWAVSAAAGWGHRAHRVGPGGALGSGGVHRRGAGGAGSGSVGSGGSGGGGIHVPTPNGGEVLLTRRHFLFGAIGVTALAAAGGAASVVLKQREEAAGNVTVLEVPARP